MLPCSVLVAVSARAAICPGLSKAQCPSLYCVWADGACSYSLQVDPLATLPLTPPACPGTKVRSLAASGPAMEPNGNRSTCVSQPEPDVTYSLRPVPSTLYLP